MTKHQRALSSTVVEARARLHGIAELSHLRNATSRADREDGWAQAHLRICALGYLGTLHDLVTAGELTIIRWNFEPGMFGESHAYTLGAEWRSFFDPARGLAHVEELAYRFDDGDIVLAAGIMHAVSHDGLRVTFDVRPQVRRYE